MAAYAALASLMNNIELMMSHPRLSISVDKKQIETLLGKADELLQFLNNNNHGGVVSKETEDLERQITSAAHLAEDVIETHMVDQILLSSAGEQKKTIKFFKCEEEEEEEEEDPERQIASAAHSAEDVIESHVFDQMHAGSNQASLESPLDLQQKIEDMDAILKKAAEVKEKWRVREEQPTYSGGNDKEKATEKQPHTTGEASSSSSSVGLEEEVEQVMDKLTLDQPEQHIISIVGMGGTGKTTLAQNVYQNPYIKHHFDFRAWATVSQKHDVREILSQLLSSQGSVDELKDKLHKTLWGRRYLIVLDDIWSIKAWDEVRRFFPDNKNRSRVVLTTRLSNIVTESGSTYCFPMKLLDEHKSWALFCAKAFKQENCPNPELENVGKEIARLCKGLPLSLVVIGGLLLKSPKTVGYWEGIAKNIKSFPNSKEKQVSLDVLSLSYNHLPPHLKPCFIYMGIFKEDSEIRVSKIINLWVAEGFLRPNEAKSLEQTGNDNLEDLISRNLVLVGKPRGNGKIGSCRIHDLLRDLCLKLAEQQELFHVMAHNFTPSTDRRLVYDNLDQIGSPIARSVMIRFRRTRSVKYKLLRVLDVNSYDSPEELYVNVNLRYIAYNHPFIEGSWKLSTSVSLLWNLQTLIFKSAVTIPLVVAPTEIWKMRQLRHVKCSGIYLPDPPPSNGKDYLENFQTLTAAINLRLSEEVCKIIPNIKKLYLIYDSWMRGYDDSLFECLFYLDRLHRLESFKMQIWTSRRPTRDTHEKLAFPNSLKKLSFSYCQFHWDDLTKIGLLPQLQVLNLYRDAVTVGEKWSPVIGQFLNLQVLKINNCCLSCWEADSSHFPKLEKLLLCELFYLKEIPLDIGEIPTLKLICLVNCSESAVISAMRIKKEQLENQGIDDLQIQVKVYSSQKERFKKNVENEGLNINDIQLQILSVTEPEWGAQFFLK